MGWSSSYENLINIQIVMKKFYEEVWILSNFWIIYNYVQRNVEWKKLKMQTTSMKWRTLEITKYSRKSDGLYVVGQYNPILDKNGITDGPKPW